MMRLRMHMHLWAEAKVLHAKDELKGLRYTPIAIVRCMFIQNVLCSVLL